MKSLLRYALRYAEHYGWKVFPLDGKFPFAGTDGFKSATTDERQIREWWEQWPHANIGVACDSEYGPIVIDIDAPKKSEVSGFKFLKTLELPEEGLVTRTAISREGRLHLYFAPMRDGTQIRRMVRPFSHNGSKVAIDILGDGGYVVAPPSMHPETGEPYRWGDRIDMVAFPKRLFRFLKKKSIQQIAPPLPTIIREGERDTLLTSLAGSMRRRQASPQAIYEALRVENAARVRPPLDDSQLRKIARSIGTKEPASDGENATDLGNARRFVAMHHSKLRSVMSKTRSPWMFWQGSHWSEDSTGEAMRLAKATVREIHKEADRTENTEESDAIRAHAFGSESSERIHAMVRLAATEPEISLRMDQFDTDRWLFNTQNGTMDLQTGKFRKHKREDYITKLSPVEFDRKAKCPKWEQFLREVLNENDELIAFIQRAVGYSLTGDTREHCLFFCYGQGRNGKSTFFEVIRELMSGYAVQADFTTFQSSRNDGPRHDLARMRGARMVNAIEARGDRSFDETIIKQMTGGDTVTARHLYESSFEFQPQFKLWLAANHLPLVREQTEAFWSRILMIPFTVTIPVEKRKKNLGERLAKQELAGIFNWALEGCKQWQRTGLQAPDSVKRAIEDYRDEFDVASEFLTARCDTGNGSWTSRSSLYQSFSDWWTEARGRNPLSHTAFNRLMSERTDVRSQKRKGVRGWRGVAVRDVDVGGYR